jgi:hypothetical protein
MGRWPVLAVLAIALGGVMLSVCPAGSRSPPLPPYERYPRASASDIKAESQKVLADPRFSRQVSIWEWLAEKLSDWRLPHVEWGSGFAGIVLWFVIIVCVMTLLAILAHLAWTIAMLLGIGGRRGAGADRHTPHFGLIPPDATYEELEALRRRLAGDGRFREAIGVMMAALLRWLEARRAVQVHPSKTNGDYVREFPAGRAESGDFRRFVRCFDGTVYGGLPCEASAYREMDILFERVQAHGRQEP